MKAKAYFEISKRNLIVLLLIIFTGCASFKSVAPLQNDKINTKSGFNTIMIIDLEIQDYSSLLQTCGNPSIWEFYKGDTQSKNRMTQHIIPGTWEQTKNSYTLHQAIELQTIAGTHKITTISFTYANKISPYKISRQYDVLHGAINYLGKIKLTVNKNGSYQTNIAIDEYSRKKSLAKFRRNNPSLYNKYSNNINTVQTEIFTDAAW